MGLLIGVVYILILFLKEQDTSMLSIDRNNIIPTAEICDIDARPYLDLIKSGNISLCDFRFYIFSGRSHLRRLLGRLSSIVDEGEDILQSVLRFILMRDKVKCFVCIFLAQKPHVSSANLG